MPYNIYTLGQLHNCHHIPPSLPPPSLPSVPPILTPNPPPPPTCWVGVGVGGGGGVNNNLSIFSAVHEISQTFEMLSPPPIPLGTPPLRSGVDKKKLLLVSGQFMTFPGLFICDPLTPPPPPGYADINSWGVSASVFRMRH